MCECLGPRPRPDPRHPMAAPQGDGVRPLLGLGTLPGAGLSLPAGCLHIPQGWPLLFPPQLNAPQGAGSASAQPSGHPIAAVPPPGIAVLPSGLPGMPRVLLPGVPAVTPPPGEVTSASAATAAAAAAALAPLREAAEAAAAVVASSASSAGRDGSLAGADEAAAPASASAASERGRKAADEAKEAPPLEKEAPKRCHLHKKPSKTCKICRRWSEQQQQQEPTQASAVPPKKADASQASKPGAAADASTSYSSSKPVFNCGAMLKDQILKSSYFKTLLNITTVDALIEEIYQFADSVDIYQLGSTTAPSVFLCCVFRLFTLEHTEEELQFLLDHPRSICARCVGFLFIRFAERPDTLWDALGEYVLDEMDFRSIGGKEVGLPASVGEYVEMLLMKEKYFGTPLPRLPMTVRRKLEEKLAPLPQYRKRTQVNRRAIKQFRERGTLVEVCEEGHWRRGTILEFEGRCPWRLKLAIALEDKRETVAHIGKVILRDPDASSGSESGHRRERRRRRSRSRSRRAARQGSPDWSRSKGKSDARMVQELREQAKDEAVCASGKEYTKRPMGFEAGLAVRREQGTAETQLIQEDTFSSLERRQQRSKRLSKEEEEERDRAQQRRVDGEQERQRKLMTIFEKYGRQTGGAGSGQGRGVDVEAPDVMRLG